MAEVFGPEREAALCREMTKVYEEILRLPLSDLLKNLEARVSIKGEIVLTVSPPAKEERLSDAEEDKIDTALKNALKIMPVKEAAATFSALTGKSKKELYTRALELKGKMKK